jgi:hypothetical protein
MKTKIFILVPVLFYALLASGQSKAKTRKGIQNRGEWRIKVYYPFAFTTSKGAQDFEMNKDEPFDYYYKSSHGTYHRTNNGIYDDDTALLFQERKSLLYRIGLGVEYNLHKRISIEAGIKKWTFRQNWDSNHVSQVGQYRFTSFPVLLKYEFFRRKFLSLKAGLGYEPSISSYKNYAAIHSKCVSYSWFLFFLICEDHHTWLTTMNSSTINARFNECFSVDFTLGWKIYKRISLDFYSRIALNSNHHQLALSYRLGK